MVRPASLAGNVAIVTGAARGIGRGIAFELARQQCIVVLVDLGALDSREPDALAETASQIEDEGGRAIPASADVTDARVIGRLIDTLFDEFGRIDILVNNAGIVRPGWSWETTPDEFEALVRVHLLGQFNCIRAVLPRMRERNYGRIVNMTSRGSLGYPLQSAYGAAKAGVIGMTYSIATELIDTGITVNAFGPVAPTRMSLAGSKLSQEELERVHITDAPFVAYLASPDAGYITGQQFMSKPGEAGSVYLYHKPAPIAELKHPDGPDAEWDVRDLHDAFRLCFGDRLVDVGALPASASETYVSETARLWGLPNHWASPRRKGEDAGSHR